MRGLRRGVFDGYAPSPTDLIVHDRSDAVFTPAEPPTTPEVWPPSADPDDPAYWNAWAEWTVPFACENEYTARSSMWRWGSGWFGTMPDGPMKDTVHAALIAKRESGKDCPGLHAIPAEEWQQFVAGW